MMTLIFLRAPRRRHATATLAAMVCTSILITGLTTATALPGTESTPPGAVHPAAADDACPEPFPVDDLAEGMEAEGLTVERGTEPEPFDATVVGVVDEGIAPGIDMILVETDSPAIERAGGIWAGMSGSPVYADDGRLIGAVAYGLSQSPSNIAGLTPAADMHKLLERPGAVSAAAAAPTQAGMRALPLPVAVSGLSADRLTSFSERLQEHLPGARTYAAGAAGIDAEAPASAIVPGGNIAAAISYGDVTSAGVGTTTAVCGDTALAFGHPFQWSGRSSASVHPAEAVLVQRDDVLGSYKVANPLGVVGTLDQDRQAGIRAILGHGPSVVPVTSTVTSTDDGTARDGTTHVAADSVLPSLASAHLLANVDRVFDAIGPGTADLRWVVEGTRASGEPFALDVQNVYASQFDIGYDSTFDSMEQIRAIQQNELEDVEISSVDFTASVSSVFERYSLSSVKIKRPDGSFQTPSEAAPVRVVAGEELAVRVTLTPYKNRGEAKTVDLTVDIPADAAGGYGWVDLVGGPVADEGEGDSGGENGNDEGDGGADETLDSPAAGKGFEGLLEELGGLVPNNSVTATLNVEQETDAGFTMRTWSDRQDVDQVVSGSHTFQLQIVP